jgi:DNA-binding NtrC family response regulator/tetratricopeptide (TPR) repeat protein
MDVQDPLAQLLGDSPEIVALRERVGRLLQHPTESRRLPPVLIRGETGTGKGLLARAVHAAGPRASGPFVDVNCAAIPATLLEAEMFGFERGAFTDARHAKPGLFHAAHRGTIFLDEVGLLPEALQGKLLKALEERAVRRLGSTRAEAVDTWVLAATSEDLDTALRERRFREDLYHRLAVVTVVLPPLRERGPDVLRLADHFLQRACAEYGLPVKTLGRDARDALLRHAWPGNVRELANVMERVAVLTDAPTVTAELLGLPGVVAPAGAAAPRERGTLDAAVREVEREHLLEALRATGWNVTHAAVRLGISRNTLRYRIEKHRLRPDGASPPPAPPAPSAPPAAPPVTAPPAVPATVRWEPRHVTVLRAALWIGPVPAGDAAGADDGPALPESAADRSRALAVLVEKVRSFGGRLAGLSPGGVLAEFGVEPTEDAPILAAHAAMAMQKAAERGQADARGHPRFRIAIHTASVLVGRVGDVLEVDRDAARDAVALLDGLVERADLDTIVVSAGAATFLRRRFELTRAPAPAGAPVAHRLAGRDRAEFGLGDLAGFVGRQPELERLGDHLAGAVAGRGQVVSLVGEPGIGKSRLVHEFRRVLARQRVPVLRARCAVHTQSTALVPLLELVRARCRIREADSPATARAKLDRALAPLGLDAAQQAALAEMLGLGAPPEPVEPEERRRRTFEALDALGGAVDPGRPVVLVVEDLQWVDRTTEEFLSAYVPRLESRGLLLLFTSRPEYSPPWAGLPFAATVPVGELSDGEAAELLDGLLPPGVPDATRRRIVERARGNPFFVEEQAWAAREEEGARPPEAVPDTVQGVLRARIARLPEEARRLLHTAAVLGPEVSRRLLGAVWEGGEPDPALRDLVRRGFLVERGGGEEPVYAFKHALTQEVTYGSLPLFRRRELHAAAGRALEELHADRLADVYDRLAYHYARTEDAAKAAAYLTRFAKQAARIYAHAEAVAALRQAREHVERLPPTGARERELVDLVLREARSLVMLGRARESVEALDREQARLDALGDPAVAAPYYFLLARTLTLVGEPARAVACARRAIAEAEAVGDETTVGKAGCILAREVYWSGRPRQALADARQALARLGRTSERVWLGQAEWVIGISHAFLGEFDPALAALDRVDALGRTLGDLRLRSYAASTAGSLRVLRGDVGAGLAACRQGVAQAPDPLNRAVALGYLGHALLETGDPAGATPLLEEALERLHAFEFRQMEGWAATGLAEARIAEGDLERAAALTERGLEIATAGGYGAGLGYARRARARLARARGDGADAARWLAQAQAAFEASEARFEVGRTHLELAGLAAAGGDRAAAARHLGAATALFDALGAGRDAARARELAARLGLAPAPA